MSVFRSEGGRLAGGVGDRSERLRWGCASLQNLGYRKKKKTKNHPTISSVFRRRPRVVERLPKNQTAAPTPVVFFFFSFEGFMPKWKIVPRRGRKEGGKDE